MQTTATTISRDTNATRTKQPAKFFTDDFLAVALFSAIGLLVSLIAAFSGEPGLWPI